MNMYLFSQKTHYDKIENSKCNFSEKSEKNCFPGRERSYVEYISKRSLKPEMSYSFKPTTLTADRLAIPE